MIDRHERSRCILKIKQLAEKLGVPEDDANRAYRYCWAKGAPIDGEKEAELIANELFASARRV
tara:strand:- start:183 stop:371 length:189 start_codon:yes stop_codon:yes gene_type:complete